MPLALITGASGGIGLELARIFARDGYDLALVARSGDKLREIARDLEPAKVQIIVKDLSRPEAAREVFEESPSVNALVNNAGYGVAGAFAETPLEDHLNLMRLNMGALVALTGLYLPGMLAARAGRILNVASTAAFQPGPLMATYYASKAFVLSFSEAIATEVKGSGVAITALCPGPTATGFAARSKTQSTNLFKRGMAMDAHTVAEMGYRGMLAGKRVVITGLRNRLLAEAVRFAPRTLLLEAVRKMQEPPP